MKYVENNVVTKLLTHPPFLNGAKTIYLQNDGAVTLAQFDISVNSFLC